MCTVIQTAAEGCSHALEVGDLLREAAVGVQGARQLATLLHDSCATKLQATGLTMSATDTSDRPSKQPTVHGEYKCTS